MKLPRIVRGGKKKRVSLSIPVSDLNLLKEYAAFYKLIYDDEITDNELIVHVLKNFMETDKDFINYLSKLLKSKKSGAHKPTK